MTPGPAVVIPNWNGRRWLPGCLQALATQERLPGEVIVVDNGSTDGSREYLRDAHPGVRVIALPANAGFARAANLGLEAAGATTPFVALVNTDVELAPDWLARTEAALAAHPEAASVACKMVALDDPGLIDDAGDVLRRDGVCEQRGRGTRDDGRLDAPGEVFGASAGAALYRVAAVRAAGGFDERYFAYLEDVDLALRLRLAGHTCRYEPAVARHAGGGSSHQLPGAHRRLVARNTLVLVATYFPARWLPLVAYRQLSWLRHAARTGRLADHVRGLAAGLPRALRAAVTDRPRRRREARVPIEVAVPARPWRGPAAADHPGRA